VLLLVHQRLLLGTPLAIPLGVPENLFHLLLSVPALVIVLLQLHSARSHVPERGQARAHRLRRGLGLNTIPRNEIRAGGTR
jgi:hypothetical protein